MTNNPTPNTDSVDAELREQLADILGYKKVGKTKIRYVSYEESATSTVEVDQTETLGRLATFVAQARKEPEITMTVTELREHFKANMLDGDSVYDCGKAMLSAESVFEYLESLAQARKGYVPEGEAGKAMAATKKRMITDETLFKRSVKDLMYKMHCTTHMPDCADHCDGDEVFANEVTVLHQAELDQAVAAARQAIASEFQTVAIPETTDYANGWNDCRKRVREDLDRVCGVTNPHTPPQEQKR